MPENVIVRGESPAGHTDEMKAVELQVFDQCVKVFRNRAGLRTRLRIRSASTPAAPIECDSAITGFDKTRNIVLPAVGIPRIRVKQYKRHTGTASVEIPQANARQVGVSFEFRARTLCCKRHELYSRWVLLGCFLFPLCASSSFPHAFSGGSTVLTTGGIRTGLPMNTFGGDNLCEPFLFALALF